MESDSPPLKRRRTTSPPASLDGFQEPAVHHHEDWQADNQQRSKWMWIVSNPTIAQTEELELYIKEHCRGGGWGLELCPQTQTAHLQGWMWLKKKVRCRTLNESVSAHLQLKPMDSNWKEVRKYCEKDHTDIFYWNDGSLPDKGKPTARADYARMATLVVDGNTPRQIAKLDPVGYMKAHMAIEALYEALRYGRQQEYQDQNIFGHAKNVIFIHGPSGTGKSRLARQLAEGFSSYDHAHDHDWFDAYENQPVVLLEEVDSMGLTDQLLLRLLDRYPTSVSRRGKSPMMWVPHTIIMTSNRPPWEVMKQVAHHQAFIRRMTYVWGATAIAPISASTVAGTGTPDSTIAHQLNSKSDAWDQASWVMSEAVKKGTSSMIK